MRKIAVVFVLLVMSASTLALLPGASEAATTCRSTWGSQGKESGATSLGDITGVRAGRHQCFDRLVIDLDGSAPGYRVGYVTSFVQDGSGATIPVSGGAILGIAVVAPAHDDHYNPTLRRSTVDAIDLTGYRTFRDVAFDGTFEGVSGFGLGVRARLPFRVFTVNGPGDGSRLIIDVAHRW